MADSNNKRKERLGDDRDKRGPKRSKGGSGGKWQTPHQVAKAAAPRGSGKIEAGDVGIWATCARHMEGKATTELKCMFEDCAHRFYGILPKSDKNADEDALEEDIEASLQKEVAAMTNKEEPNPFSPVHLDMDCVLFFKTQPPIDPVDFTHRICEELVSKPCVRRMRYVNRLTPSTMIVRATEKDLEGLGKVVLGAHFQLSGEDGKSGKQKQQHTYAIRPTIRAHTVITRDVLIKQIALMIDESHHKVNLTKPDKVILIEIYQSVCAMSVVDGDWETLKRFNLAELNKLAPQSHIPSTAEAVLESGRPMNHKSDVASKAQPATAS